MMMLTGTNLMMKGISSSARLTVLLMLADTLAAHAVGRYKVGVGFALRKCRDCMATKETMSQKSITEQRNYCGGRNIRININLYFVQFKAEDFVL